VGVKRTNPGCTTLLLCEGNDCKQFFIQVIEKLNKVLNYSIENIYVDDVNGINDKKVFADVSARPDFNNLETIVYARDAEYPEKGETTDIMHYQSVIESIKKRFRSIGLDAPDKPLTLMQCSEKRCGYIILSADPSADNAVGTLEDLCVAMAVDREAVKDSEEAIENVNQKRNNKLIVHKHKRLFHCFLSFNEDKEVVGALTGQAVMRGALNLDNEMFRPITDFLIAINS
jgi:hypothetical protein